MQPRALVASVLLLAPTFACGDEGSTAPPTIVDPDVIAGCDPASCFDEDFCTDDFCQSDGSCVHVPRNPFGACQTAAHCDDDNPCTDEVCALDECGLMRCQEGAWRQGCQPCMFGCEDGDPCTVDSCDEAGICVHSAPDPHCDPACRQDAALPVSSAQWVYAPAGVPVSFVGTAAPASGNDCDGGLCACTSELALGEYGYLLPLAGAGELAARPWSCAVTACEVGAASCDPLRAGVGYVVWGVMRYLEARESAGAAPQADTWASDADVAPPTPPIDAFEVTGYCLSTRWDHLPGLYQAELDSDGRRAAFSVALATTADGVVSVSLGACAGCAEVGLVDGQTSALANELGVVSFPLALTDGPAFVRLYARGDRLIGDLERSDGAFVGVLSLERR